MLGGIKKDEEGQGDMIIATYMVNRRPRMVTTEYVFWGPSALAHGFPITP